MRPLRFALILLLLASSSMLRAQFPFSGPLKAKAEQLAQQFIDARVAAALGKELPLRLDASHTYPTVPDAQLPGGPFHGVETEASNLAPHQPMASGDLTIPVVAFCSEYSVHRPGQGVVHKLGPVEGRLAESIAALLRDGLLAGYSPATLQSVSWAIQAGVPYSKMPEPYQQIIDKVIPGSKPALEGSWTDRVEAEYTGGAKTYNAAAKWIPRAPAAPSLEAVLARLGTPGRLMLDALLQQKLILARYSSNAEREAVLVGHQGDEEKGLAVGAGPWTVIREGRVYVRLRVKGGNLAENSLDVRIIGSKLPARLEAQLPTPRLLQARYDTPLMTGADSNGEANPTLAELLEGPVATHKGTMMMAYSQGQATQALALALPSGQHPCDDPDLPATYDKNHNWHQYGTASVICNSHNTPGCTVDLVYQALLATPSAIGPTYPGGQHATNCGVLTLVPGPHENNVRTYFDEAHHKVTNYTMPGHIFYPGQIDRQILGGADGTITIQTTGFGNGHYRCLNVVGGSEIIWPLADQSLCNAVTKMLPKGKNGKAPAPACQAHPESSELGGSRDSTIEGLIDKCTSYELEP